MYTPYKLFDLMSENLTKDSIIDGATVEQWFQLVKVTKDRIDNFGIPAAVEPDIPSTNLLVVKFGEVDDSYLGGFGFKLPIFFDNVEQGNEFIAFQWDTAFPEGVNFEGIELGEIFSGAIRAQAADGHRFEGRVGGFTSSLNACKKSGVLVTLLFTGPSIAAEEVKLKNFRVTGIDYYSVVETFYNERIEHA